MSNPELSSREAGGTTTGGYVIGVDLGGSSVKAISVSAAGQKLASRLVDFDPEAEMEWAQAIRSAVDGLEREQGSRAASLGLCAPGLAASDARSIACMPARLAGLEGFDWTDFLERDRKVPVLNDGHAALLGEAWLGAGRGCRNLFMITLGTGVGGAAMVDGHLLLGHIGRAGHLGHISLDPEGAPDICGTPASLEMAIGTIDERTDGRYSTTHELLKARLDGDAAADKIWKKSVKALATAISGLINVLDPKAVIVGGGIARAGEELLRPLGDFLQEMEWRPTGTKVRLVPAKLGELAGAYGAARIGMEPTT